MTPCVVSASPAHLTGLGHNLRQEDRDEILAASGLDPMAGLLACAKLTPDLWAAVIGDEPIAVFGAAPVDSDTAGPWMMASDRLREHRFWMARESITWFDRLALQYRRLTNWVDARNENHARWLEWLGCDFVETRSLGPFNLPFRRFEYLS